MVRVVRLLSLAMIMILLLHTASGVIASDFGYGDVFWFDEETGQWVKDIDGTMATMEKRGDGGTFSGNVGGSASASGSAVIDFEDPGFSTLTSVPPERELALTNTLTWVGESTNGRLSITVEALPFNDPSLTDMVWDPEQGEFFLAHPHTVAEFRFTYTVTNLNASESMREIELRDHLGAELVIDKNSVIVTGTDAHVNIYRGGNGNGNYRFSMDPFTLGAGQSVEVTFIATTGSTKVVQLHYSCGDHDLNSQAKFKYTFVAGKKYESINGWTFPIRVCGDPPQDSPTLCIEMSASGVEWYIRKPGDYFAKVLDVKVSVIDASNRAAQVKVAFSGFDNLASKNKQEITVFYSLADESGPAEWMPPVALNETELRLAAVDQCDSSFSMWQKIVLGTQGPGKYENTGVITFSLVNSQPILCD